MNKIKQNTIQRGTFNEKKPTAANKMKIQGDFYLTRLYNKFLNILNFKLSK